MDLETFYADVSAEIGRGTSQDARIPRWARNAIRFIEQTRTMEYMKQYGELTIDPELATPHVIALPSSRVKSIELIRDYAEGVTLGQTDLRVYGSELRRINAGEITSISREAPAGYYLIGTSAIGVDAVPETAMTYELVFNEFTDWPAALDAEPTILQRYDNLMFAQTMVQAAIGMKDQGMQQTWQIERESIFRMVDLSEQELTHSGRRYVMRPGVPG